MSLGKRGSDEKQEPIWIEAARLATPAGHPFYERLNRLLSKRGFDEFAESACAPFYQRQVVRVWLLELTSAHFWSDTSKVSIPNAVLRGGQPIRWPCGRFWVLSWVSRHRITDDFPNAPFEREPCWP